MSDRIEKVHALADGELTLEEAKVVSLELKEDAALAREYQWATYIPELLRAKCTACDSSEVWKAARARLDAIDAVRGNKRIESVVGRYSWAMAACLFAVILFAGIANRGTETQVSGQQMAGVVGALGADKKVTDQEEAERVLAQQIGPDFGSVVQVTSVAKGEIDGHKFTKVLGVDGSGALMFVVLDSARSVEGMAAVEGRSEYVGGVLAGANCVCWTKDDKVYMVSSDRPIEALVAFADQIRFGGLRR